MTFEDQLRQERDRLQRRVVVISELLDESPANGRKKRKRSKKRGKMSAAGRKRIAAAQRARWAKLRKEKKTAE